MPARSLILAVSALLALPAIAAADAPAWRLEQPDPPAGARFKVPLGRPGDLEFYAPNNGLLAVEGNDTIPRGLYHYDGTSWKPLATVCGDTADQFRVAYAGPSEFWTISAPSRPRIGGGTALCHFKDGQVVGSYSQPDESADPFLPMDAAKCDGPNNCWFAGIGGQAPGGRRIGAFHIHWDGSSLTTSYFPQGRGVSDLVRFDGRFYESTFVGIGREDRDDKVSLASPEVAPQLIHSFSSADDVRSEPFNALPPSGVSVNGTELLSADASGDQLWFGGGGAASGPAVPSDGVVHRPPELVHYASGFFQEVPLDRSQFSDTERFADIAAVPGTQSAWVASQPFGDRSSTTAKAKVALIDANGQTSSTVLPTSGAGRGAAAKIAFTSPTDGWMVTTAGWLFHYTDGTAQARDDNSAFASLITFRPNEAAAQFIADAPPADDSQLFAPAPTDDSAATATASTTTGDDSAPARRKALLYKVSKAKVSRKLVLSISFSQRRAGKVQLVARRKGKTVAKTKLTAFKPGRHTLRLKLSRKRFPTALKFVTKEAGASSGDGSSGTTTGAPGVASSGTGNDSPISVVTR